MKYFDKDKQIKFDLNEYINLLETTNTFIQNESLTYNARFHENFRSSPFLKIEPYIIDTVRYGNFNSTRNKLLFGGEMDYITLNIYDLLIYTTIWRMFNVLNDTEYNKIKQNNPKLEEQFKNNNTQFGIKYIIQFRNKTASFDRHFESISSPKVISRVLDEIKKYLPYDFGEDLYNRFKLFGFENYIDSIGDIEAHHDDLTNQQISKSQYVTYDLTPFADPNCQYLNSIYDYTKYLSTRVDSRLTDLKRYYLDIFNTKDYNKIFKLCFDKFQSLVNLAYYIHYPILYNLKK